MVREDEKRGVALGALAEDDTADLGTNAKKADDQAAAAAAQARKSADEKATTESASDSPGTQSKADRGNTDGEASGGGARARSGESAAPSCTKQNRFPTGTRVQMADGTSKAIEDVRVGDKVLATDPQTGETAPKTVTAAIITPDDKEFTDLTLSDDANPRGPPATLTSTAHHPHWNETRRQRARRRRIHPDAGVRCLRVSWRSLHLVRGRRWNSPDGTREAGYRTSHPD
ncbi:hypothetical protein ADK61_35420 [Streptomyces sp. XY66]|uniref:Hint domain-containing protein n=1 Tax=Streptomyces sp. XY66 TaxID=1415563 RepID=UPI0006AED439|nr:hypothetical protein ADK61_35420 [Streptomyces sp. XY66]